MAALGTGYGLWEASQIRVRRQTIALPGLPDAFAGKTIAVLADFHHGPFVGLEFLRRAVALAQDAAADAYALVGDFAHKGSHTAEQLPPCLEVLAGLRAPLGVFAVPGNHDMQHGGRVYRDAVRPTPLTDLTNRAVRVSVGSDALWLAGVDDLWWGKPDLPAALRDVPAGAAVVLLAHNPDFAEECPDPRVGLVLSGHTHGGQVCLPGVGALWTPSRYGDKYRAGLVQGPASQVFVSRGLGESFVPVRLNCPPEINLLELTPGAAKQLRARRGRLRGANEATATVESTGERSPPRPTRGVREGLSRGRIPGTSSSRGRERGDPLLLPDRRFEGPPCEGCRSCSSSPWRQAAGVVARSRSPRRPS